jgi:hypothetical protein
MRRAMPRQRTLTVFLLALSLVGCAGAFRDGVRQYNHGRYPEAALSFRRLEWDAQEWSPRDRATYALYRGLTHLALGDRTQTLVWLGVAKRAFDADPRVFSDEDGGKLASAWAHLPEDPNLPPR